MLYLKIYLIIVLLTLPRSIQCYLVNENMKLSDARLSDVFIWLFFIPLWIFAIKELIKGGDKNYRQRIDRLEIEKKQSKIRWEKRRK